MTEQQTLLALVVIIFFFNLNSFTHVYLSFDSETGRENRI